MENGMETGASHRDILGIGGTNTGPDIQGVPDLDDPSYVLLACVSGKVI